MTLAVRAALVSLALLISGCTTSTSTAAVKPAEKRRLAPDFELKDADGRAVKLSDYRGKVVLLNFWATWCGPCKVEIPWFIDFETRMKDSGFAVLGVAMDEEGWEVIRPYIQAKKMNYRVLAGSDQVAQQYGGVDSLPTSFLIDREGKIGSVHIGLVSKGVYESDIKQLLAKPAGTAVRTGNAVDAVTAGAN